MRKAEVIKCPQCGSTKLEDLGNDSYKCEYCGSVFTPERVQEEPQGKVVVQQVIQQVPTKGKNRTTAGVLAIFLGTVGVHQFYLGNTVRGIIYLVLCWTYIPTFVGFVEGIIFLCMSDHDFDKKYNQITS